MNLKGNSSELASCHASLSVGNILCHDSECIKPGNENHICIVIQMYVATAILCLRGDFNTLLYLSAKSKSYVTSNVIKCANVVLTSP